MIPTGGRSGAVFTVAKRGTDPAVVSRLHAQYRWLLPNRPRVVHVHDVFEDGYMMELLEGADADVPTRLAIIADILETEVWSGPAAPIDWARHLEAIRDRGAPSWLVRHGAALGPPAKSCVTHGDPTAENLMVRPNSREWVLIDPVPDASCGTGERAADMGKMLQSAVGYEELRAGRASLLQLDRAAVDVVRRSAQDAAEWARARYWLGVWLTMICRYQTPEVSSMITASLNGLRSFIEGRPAVFLDRDGTLNFTIGGVPPRGVADTKLIGGAREACALLRGAGYALIIVTNQSEIAYGTLTRQTVNAVNDLVREATQADDAFVCPHGRDEGCSCRKPRPGMLQAASKKLDISFPLSWIVGDKDADVGAGRAAGLRGSILIPRDEKNALLRVVREKILSC